MKFSFLLLPLLLLSSFPPNCKCVDEEEDADVGDDSVSIEESAFSFDKSSTFRTDSSTKKSHPCEAKHIHLAVGSKPWRSMTVSFSTACPPSRAIVSLSYGLDPFHLDDDVVADPKKHMIQYNHTGTSIDGEEVLDEYRSDYIYHVPLKHLKENTVYFYVCSVETKREASAEVVFFEDGSNKASFQRQRELKSKSKLNLRHHGEIYKSPLSHFVTAPAPGFATNMEGDPIKIALVGDLGQSYDSSVTMYHMLLEAEGRSVHSPATVDTPQTKAMIAICAGDMSYADNMETRWDSWFELVEPLASRVPFMIAPGNHETECDRVTHDIFQAYQNRFHMPQIQRASQIPLKDCSVGNSHISQNYNYGNAYYSFTYGIVKIIALSSYTDSARHSPQYQFLHDELKAADRSVTPWILVFFHCPFYNTFDAHVNEKSTVRMKESLEPLFLQYGVNFVISGHTHAYMRSKNVAYNEVVKKGPIYIVVGAGGNREGHTKKYQSDTPENWVEVRDGKEFGFGTLEFMNQTQSKWTWIRNEDVHSAGITDESYIENQFI